MIEIWFPTIIYYDFLRDIDNASLVKRAYQIRDELEASTYNQWDCDTWNSLNTQLYYKDDEMDSVIRKLIDATVLHTEKYAAEYRADLENYRIECTGFWFNIAEPENFQEYHQHPNNLFSAVYYVDVQPNSGEIIFKSMDSVASSITVPIALNYAEVNSEHLISDSLISESCSYTPENGKILIFKSNLLHMVKKNLSNSDRISIGMNFNLVPK